MRVVQLSDFHMEPAGTLAYAVADTLAHTKAAVQHIAGLTPRPDVVVISGDVASSGRAEAYALVRQQLQYLASCGVEIYVLPGNHDHRQRMLEYLADWCPAEADTQPYICYTVEHSPQRPLRLIMLDTMRPGSHAGHLEPQIAHWLERTLAHAPSTPTLLFMHHPPFASGMGLMDEAFGNKDLLAAILCKNPQTRLCCGHMHRGFATLWAGCLSLCAPSTAMQIHLQFDTHGGNDFVMEAPGYVLHHWNGEHCNSHFCQIPGTHSYSGPHPFAGVVNPQE